MLEDYKEQIKWVRTLLPKDTEGSHMYGVPLEAYTKKDLIKLLVMVGSKMQVDARKHSEQLNKVVELFKRS